MWPTELWSLLDMHDVEPTARFLFMCLFLHPDIDSGGFVAFQPKVLASMTGLHEDRVRTAIEHLESKGLVVVDRRMERLWLVPFIEYDTSRKPNMYVSAMRAVREVVSRPLKAAAWQEIQRIHPPPMKMRDPKKPEVYERLAAERDQAYAELTERIDRERITEERLGNGSRTVAEPPSEPEPGEEEVPRGTNLTLVPSPTATCSGCGEQAATGGIAWRPDLCRDCAEGEKHPSMRNGEWNAEGSTS